MGNKNLQLDRLVFFSDAVVAIAITLLAFNLKIENPRDSHFSFYLIYKNWQIFVPFILSFINIANYWKTHHVLFIHINKINDKLVWFNVSWLFFMVLLPFSTSIVSSYFFDKDAIIVYSINLFLISVFQNFIWDYASITKSVNIESSENMLISHIPIRVYCNLDMLNCIIAIIVAFFYPTIAFILLFTKLPLQFLARFYFISQVSDIPFGKSKNQE